MSWTKVLKQEWSTLAGVRASLPDPYLVWAHLTGWVDLRDEAMCDPGVAVILELVENKTASCLRRALELVLPSDAWRLPAMYKSSRYATLWLRSSDLLIYLATPSNVIAKLIHRFEISVANVPGQPTPQNAEVLSIRGKVLMGVIDSGCPFANDAMTSRHGGTRISAFWDMSRGSRLLTSKPLAAASPASMGYGLEVRKAGIDKWMAEFLAEGTVDAAACYQAGGFPDLRGQVSHGAHVLDVLAGPIPLRNRMYASEGSAPAIYTDPDSPPTWEDAEQPVSDPSQTDIAFVQLPRTALQDGTGGWLGSHILDAVNYVMGCAGKSTRHVVINISYGCTTGPHDGTSILECALDEFETRKNPVKFVLASGNSFSSAGHAVLKKRHCEPGALPLVWRVLPDGQAPSFLQVWLPQGSNGQGFEITITPPGVPDLVIGVGEVVVWPTREDPTVTAIFLSRTSRGNCSSMVLLALAPTESADGSRATAPHGDWEIRVSGSLSETEVVHAYAARNDRDFGTLLRGRTSRFIDLHEPLSYLRRSVDDDRKVPNPIDSDPERADAVVTRRGTMNGIATGSHVLPVGGYVRRTGSHASYSSAGATHGGRSRLPESACATDESAAMLGMRAAGNVGASTFRLVGTSTAAPQRARMLVNAFLGSARQNSPARTAQPDDPVDAADLWGEQGRLPVVTVP